MHQKHLYSVRIKHAVVWSPKRESTVCVPAKETQNRTVSLLHVLKQVFTLHSNPGKFNW